MDMSTLDTSFINYDLLLFLMGWIQPPGFSHKNFSHPWEKWKLQQKDEFQGKEWAWNLWGLFSCFFCLTC